MKSRAFKEFVTNQRIQQLNSHCYPCFRLRFYLSLPKVVSSKPYNVDVMRFLLCLSREHSDASTRKPAD